jgi:osmoprotectant transport system substrate-binding protein
MTRRSLKAIASAVAAVLAAGALGACGGDDPATPKEARTSGPPVRIGTKDFTEQFILGELYSRALRAKGFRVELKRDVGSSEIIHRALEGGALDMYPEYIGVLLSEIANRRERPRSPAAAHRAAKDFEERRGFTLLAMTPFSDSNALAVKRAFARRHDLRTIADLGQVPGTVEIGAAPEFRTRYEGLLGLTDRYRLDNLQVKSLPIGKQYAALEEGEVDVAAVFTTDGQLRGRDYVLLEDPRGLFASQRVSPVISRRALRAHGRRLTATIDAVSRRITTAAMRKMNAAVDEGRRSPGSVADAFLRSKGLK